MVLVSDKSRRFIDSPVRPATRSSMFGELFHSDSLDVPRSQKVVEDLNRMTWVKKA